MVFGLMVGDVFCESLPGGVGGAKASSASQILVVSCCGVLGGLRVKRQALSGLLSTPDLEPLCVVWGVGVCCCMFGWLVWLVGVWLVGCW